MPRLRSLLFIILLLSPALAYGQRCVVDVVVLNVDRKVRGPISAECSRVHSIPFGNWGAEFPYFRSQRLRDGYQFSGWKAEDGWLQWNSCTTHSDYGPPDSRYYNHEGDSTQIAAPNVVNVVDTRRDHINVGPSGVSCKRMTQDQAFEFGATQPVELKVYELDRRIPFIDGPDHVATLEFSYILVPYSCADGDEWDCSGESEWIEPVAGATSVSARLKLRVHLHKRESER